MTVRALTRSGNRCGQFRALGADEVVVGNLLEETAVRRIVEGMDAVISVVRTHPTHVYRRSGYVDGYGNVNLVDVAEKSDVNAIVIQSALDVGDDRTSLMAHGFRLLLGPVIAAKTRDETTIRDAGLRYAIFCRGVLVGDLARDAGIVTDATSARWAIVGRPALARYPVAALYTPAVTDRTFDIVWNPVFDGVDSDIDWTLPDPQ